MLTKEDLQAIAGLLVPIETRIGNLESRFDNLESRFDKLESRFDNLESRFDSLETRVDNFESETKRRFENLEANLRSVDKHVCELDASVSELQRSVKELWLHVENTTDWKLQVVAENHSNLLQKLKTRFTPFSFAFFTRSRAKSSLSSSQIEIPILPPMALVKV